MNVAGLRGEGARGVCPWCRSPPSPARPVHVPSQGVRVPVAASGGQAADAQRPVRHASLREAIANISPGSQRAWGGKTLMFRTPAVPYCATPPGDRPILLASWRFCSRIHPRLCAVGEPKPMQCALYPPRMAPRVEQEYRGCQFECEGRLDQRAENNPRGSSNAWPQTRRTRSLAGARLRG